MNRKGFTLVELLAALVILGILVSIGGVAITKTINGSKEKNYETLVANIKSGVEAYYQECKYGLNAEKKENGGQYLPYDCLEQTTLGNLVKYGYLNYNGKKTSNDKNYNILINPKTDDDITNCTVAYSVDINGKMTLTSSGVAKCPTTKHYQGDFKD